MSEKCVHCGCEQIDHQVEFKSCPEGLTMGVQSGWHPTNRFTPAVCEFREANSGGQWSGWRLSPMMLMPHDYREVRVVGSGEPAETPKGFANAPTLEQLQPTEALQAKVAELERERDEIGKRLLADDSDSVVGACNCLTKSPDIQYHKQGCKYRLIQERDNLQRERDEARKDFDAMSRFCHEARDERDTLKARVQALEEALREIHSLAECRMDTSLHSIERITSAALAGKGPGSTTATPPGDSQK